MRGIGLPKKEEFRWAKQPNKKITIFDVPIFKSYRRETKYQDPKSGEEKTYVDEVTPQEILRIEETFKKLKSTFKYPRLHIGHHDNESTESKEPCGYADFFYTKDVGNETFLYADLIEIPQKIFDLIWDDTLPYRSAEYIPGQSKIRGIALLPSQEPFFHDLGILNEKTLFSMPERIQGEVALNFQNRSKFLARLEKEEGMGFFSKTQKYSDSEDYPKEKEETENHSDDDETVENKEDGGSMEEKFMAFMERCEKKFEELESRIKGSSYESQEEPRGLQPSTGSYKENEMFKAFQAGNENVLSAINKMNERMKKLEDGKFDEELSEKIKNYCAISGEEFGNVHSFLKKIGGKENKLAVLEDKINMANAHRNFFDGGNHPSSRILQGKIVPADKIMEKYQEEHPHIQKLIPEMVRDYQDNMEEFMKPQMKSVYPDVEAWVSFNVKEEKSNPGNYMTKIRKA